MLPDAGAQPFYFVNELIAGQVLQVFVHKQFRKAYIIDAGVDEKIDAASTATLLLKYMDR